MGSPSVDIKDILCDNSSFAFNDNVFVGMVPQDKPETTQDAVLGIRDTGGSQPEGISDIEYPTVQIICRALPFKYTEGYNLIKSAEDILHGQGGVTKNSSYYLGIWSAGAILFIGYDEKNRPEFSLNFRMQRS